MIRNAWLWVRDMILFLTLSDRKFYEYAMRSHEDRKAKWR